jgi:tetratricopeptide (TPR) repeat protein
MGMIAERMMHPDDSSYLEKAVGLASGEKDPEEVLENFASFAGAIGFSSHEQWIYRKWAELQPENDAPLNQLGLIMESNGNLEESVTAYERSLELQPGNPWIYLALAEVHRKKGDNERALQICSNCIEVISEDASEENIVALKEISSFMKNLE